MNEPPNPEVAVFAEALELPADQRGAFLDQACAGDEALRRQVEALLRVHDDAGSFFDKLAPAARPTCAEGAMPGSSGSIRLPGITAERTSGRIGRYKLLQQIGEGGCGVVYMAEQEEPVRRLVALKVIKLGMDTKNVIARFEAERQALALMDHPNIARVLDAGTTETGRPYFVMELVRGIKITDYCDENKLTTSARLELFVQVCQAIQHAHQKGIIHRDIKPSNILVADHDGLLVPKVIDFGIAKATTDQQLTDKTLFTAFEQFIGTPAYMSPEQARLSGSDIDTRSDIYSLGVLLYELLTAKTPFESKRLLEMGLDEIRRVIREEEPPRPSTRLHTLSEAERTTVARHRQCEPLKLLGLIRGDLDWIVMKALEKDLSRRYETSSGLARDVQRYLKDEPILARPPSKLYLCQKLVSRNRVAFAAALVVIATLVLGLAAATVAALRIRRDDRQIQKANDEATQKLWASYLAESRANRVSGRAGQRFASLEAVEKAAAIRPDLAVRNEAIASMAVSDLRVSKETQIEGRRPDDLVRYDFNLEKYADGEEDGGITVRSVKDDRALAVLPAPGFTVRWVGQFSPNSRYLRAAYWQEQKGFSTWVWDLDRNKTALKELPGFLAAQFSSDSRLFAASSPEGIVSVFNLGSGEVLSRLACARSFQHMVFNPSNTKLACFNEDDPRVEIREIESGRIVQTLNCPSSATAAAWSPDGRSLATGCADFRIYLWDWVNGQRLSCLIGHDQHIMNVAFSHNGNFLASAGFDGMFRLWNPGTGRQIACHSGAAWYFQFSADDRHLEGWQEVSKYGSLEVAASQECRLFYSQSIGERYSGPEFSADGRIVAAGTGDRVCFWDVFSGKEISSLLLADCDTHIFHPDGRSLIVIDRSGGVRLRSLARMDGPASSAFRLGKPRRVFDAKWLRGAALSLDGRHLAVTHEPTGESFILDLQDPSSKVVLTGHPLVDYIAISPDGHWAATGSWHNFMVKIWDTRSGDCVRTLYMPARTTVAFSPDGRWLATSTTKYQLWEVGSWQPKSPPEPGHPVAQWNFTAFSPDGRLMARITDGRNIQLQEVLTEKPLAILEAPGLGSIARIQFSPDGAQLAVQQQDQQVRFWNLRLIRQELAQMHLDWDMPPYPQSDKAATGEVTLEVESDPSVPAPGR